MYSWENERDELHAFDSLHSISWSDMLPAATPGPQQAQRLLDAKQSLAVELCHCTRLLEPPPMVPRIPYTKPSFGSSERSWDFAYYTMNETAEALQQKAMLCDLRFRAMSITTANQVPPSGLSQEGRPPVRTPQFEYACNTFRCQEGPAAAREEEHDEEGEGADFSIDIDQFLRQIDVYTIPENAYGTTGDVLRLAHEIQHHQKTALGLMVAIVDEMKARRAFGPMAVVCTEEEARMRIDDFLAHNLVEQAVKARVKQRIEGRLIALRSARTLWNDLTSRVNEHVRLRVERNEQFLVELDDDIVDVIGKFLGSRTSVCYLMRTCKRFSRLEQLRQLLPHLRIRTVLGSFPHYREVSRDRTALAKGIKRQEVREFVLNRKAVHLYVDFCYTERRKEPLKKKPRRDGLSHLERDLSDDEYEEPPESSLNRVPRRRVNPYSPPPPSLAADPTQPYNRFERTEDNRRERWHQLEGPDEPFDRFTTRARVNYSHYFFEPLECSVELVYADTHEPVPSPDYKGGIVPSNVLSRDGLVFSQPSKRDLHQYHPAQAKFHIKELSAVHSDRLFKLKVTGRGKFLPSRGGGDAVLVAHTSPFEVNSRESVVKGGRLRRTAEEVAKERSDKAKRVKKSV